MGQENLAVLRGRINFQDWSISSDILTDITIILFFNIYIVLFLCNFLALSTFLALIVMLILAFIYP